MTTLRCSRVHAVSAPIFISPSQALGVHPDDQLPEVASLEHADEGSRRALETVDDVLTVADAAVADAGTDLAQKVGIVLGGEFVVDEAAHRAVG